MKIISIVKQVNRLHHMDKEAKQKKKENQKTETSLQNKDKYQEREWERETREKAKKIRLFKEFTELTVVAGREGWVVIHISIIFTKECTDQYTDSYKKEAEKDLFHSRQ